MSKAGRVVTIALVIDEPEKADWIWDSMKDLNSTDPKTGVRVFAITNGNLFEEKDVLEEGLKRIAGHICTSDDEELEGCYDDAERADLILERMSNVDKKYEYDPVLCQYNHDLVKKSPGSPVKQAGAESNETRT